MNVDLITAMIIDIKKLGKFRDILIQLTSQLPPQI